MESNNKITIICSKGFECPDRINNKCTLLHLPPQDVKKEEIKKGGKKPPAIDKVLPGFCKYGPQCKKRERGCTFQHPVPTNPGPTPAPDIIPMPLPGPFAWPMPSPIIGSIQPVAPKTEVPKPKLTIFEKA